jgi:hypothetical protein
MSEAKKAKLRKLKFCILAGTFCNATCILLGRTYQSFQCQRGQRRQLGPTQAVRGPQWVDSPVHEAKHHRIKVRSLISFAKTDILNPFWSQGAKSNASKARKNKSRRKKTAIEIGQSSGTFTEHRILRPGPKSFMSNPLLLPHIGCKSGALLILQVQHLRNPTAISIQKFSFKPGPHASRLALHFRIPTHSC